MAFISRSAGLWPNGSASAMLSAFKAVRRLIMDCIASAGSSAVLGASISARSAAGSLVVSSSRSSAISSPLALV